MNKSNNNETIINTIIPNQRDRIGKNRNTDPDLHSLLNECKKDDLIKFILRKQQEKIINVQEIKQFFSENSSSCKNFQESTKKDNPESIILANDKKNGRLNFCDIRTFAFKFMYIGENYDGLVFQSHTKNTVEEHILNALKNANL